MSTSSVKILKPGIIFATIVTLGAVSVVGLAVAGEVLRSAERTRSVDAVQALILIASLISITYLVIHGIAAAYNDPVGIARPPEGKLHIAGFISARLALLLWAIASTAACAVVARPGACVGGSRTCHLQIVDVVAAVVGFTAAGVILTALESCKYPFQMPQIFCIRREANLGAHPPGQGILNRSVSQASLFGSTYDSEKAGTAPLKSSTEKPPLQKSPSAVSELLGRPLTSVNDISGRNRSGSWGLENEWTQLEVKSGSDKKAASDSDSGVSLSYETSSDVSGLSDSWLDRRSHVSRPRRAVIARRPVRPRSRNGTVTPSSSISNLSRRSPLSSVRSAEYPHILIRPELTYCPPKIPPPHVWNPSRTSSASQLVPVAEVHHLQQRPSTKRPETYELRGPRNNLSSLFRSRSPLASRGTNDIKGPGALRAPRKDLDHDSEVEEHVRKIEDECATRSQSQSDQCPSAFVRRKPGNFDCLSPPLRRVDSIARYREKRPLGQAHSPVAKICPHSAYSPAARMEPEAPKEFKRLSLGDPSLGRGNITGLENLFD